MLAHGRGVVKCARPLGSEEEEEERIIRRRSSPRCGPREQCRPVIARAYRHFSTRGEVCEHHHHHHYRHHRLFPIRKWVSPAALRRESQARSNGVCALCVACVRVRARVCVCVTVCVSTCARARVCSVRRCARGVARSPRQPSRRDGISEERCTPSTRL